MVKRTKQRPTRNSTQTAHDQTTSMMTQQEQKMFYSSKKHNVQQSSHQQNLKRGQKTQTNNENDQDQGDLGPIEFSNLNQTSAQEITQFINKLIAKNKVTSKNAFDIPLIHLQQMEDFRASLNENTWKRLSSTLENDYKIYGYRVDAAHTITYKMVESIARHEATLDQSIGPNNQNINRVNQSKKISNNDFSSSIMENSFNQNVSKNKLNVDYQKYVQKNQKLLNVSHIQSFFGYNPGLQRTKRKFDQQGLKALLLNNINLRNGCELKLDQHHNYEMQRSDQAKKQADQITRYQQTQQFNQDDFDDLFGKILTRDENEIMVENDESIFTKIYNLNVNQGGINNNDYLKYERLYKIISGEDRQQKRLMLRRKGEPIIEQSNQNNRQNNEIEINNNFRSEQNKDNVQNKVIDNIQHEQNGMMNNNLVGMDIQNEDIINKNINNPQVINSQKLVNVQKDINNNDHHDHNNNNNNNNNDNKQNKQKIKQQKQLVQQRQQHILNDKNFQIHEVNINNLDQEQQQKQIYDLQKKQYQGKYKNIQEYIKITQPKFKSNKKVKIQIHQLTQQQIAKKLFNKNYKKKKQSHKNNNISHTIKQQHQINHKPKVNFNKLNKPIHDLKRSLIFKKSIQQEKLFIQTKQKIKSKLQKKHKNKIIEEEQDSDKRKKGKKISKLFDLPVYQFQQGDINFINPFQEIDPQTTQLQFSQLYKYNCPSFVFSSNQILENIRKKKEQKKKRQLEKNKLLEQQKKRSELLNQDINAQQINENFNDQANYQGEHNQTHQEQQQLNEPDISFIYDEMGQIKGNHVVIREAKQKVRKIMLNLFLKIKSKKNNKGKKNKQNKISFKQIYEAYYRQQGFISPALCFLTILHLANEHDLILEGKQDGTDFKIFVQEQNKMKQNCLDQNNSNQIEMCLEISVSKKKETIEKINKEEQKREQTECLKSTVKEYCFDQIEEQK